MGKSIIKAIFKGERGNHENIPDSEMLDEHIERFWNYEELFKKVLNDEQKSILELYSKEQSSIEYERESLAFCEGFKIGLRIALESIT